MLRLDQSWQKNMKKSLSMIALTLAVGAVMSLPASAATKYTAAQVATHNTNGDCWTIVSKRIYNLTSFIASHASSSTMLTPMCGNDSSAVFQMFGNNGNGKVGQLADSYIGDLQDVTAPSVPTGLTAFNIQDTWVNLRWTKPTDDFGVKGYNVYRNGTQVGTTSALTFKNIGLTPTTTYSFAVAAFDAAGNLSAQSSAITVTTLATSTMPVKATSTNPCLNRLKKAEIGHYEYKYQKLKNGFQCIKQKITVKKTFKKIEKKVVRKVTKTIVRNQRAR
jgi:cytochrome b involved in lipid metabolism